MTPTVFLDFQPRQLVIARQSVVERHPSTRQIPATAPVTRLEELHSYLLACGGESEALRRFADGLNGRELRGVARSLGKWDDVRPAIVQVIRRRRRSTLLQPLWHTWEEYPDIPEVIEACLEIGAEYGWGDVVHGRLVHEVHHWILATSSGRAIQEWLAGQGLTYSDLTDLEASPLRHDTPLTRSVRDAVMTSGTVAQLRAEGGRRLLGWLPELSPDDKQRFGRHYLTALGPRGWEEPVVDTIKERFGSPKQQRFQFFWAPVPPETKDAFLRWYIERKLNEVFAGDSERHRFWHGHIDSLEDIEIGKAGGVEYAWLVFKTFAVVEFFQLGNAAYFYPIAEARALQTRKPSYPGSLKERKTFQLKSRPVSNYLIHSQNWQATADRMIWLWTRGS